MQVHVVCVELLVWCRVTLNGGCMYCVELMCVVCVELQVHEI